MNHKSLIIFATVAFFPLFLLSCQISDAAQNNSDSFESLKIEEVRRYQDRKSMLEEEFDKTLLELDDMSDPNMQKLERKKILNELKKQRHKLLRDYKNKMKALSSRDKGVQENDGSHLKGKIGNKNESGIEIFKSAGQKGGLKKKESKVKSSIVPADLGISDQQNTQRSFVNRSNQKNKSKVKKRKTVFGLQVDKSKKQKKGSASY